MKSQQEVKEVGNSVFRVRRGKNGCASFFCVLLLCSSRKMTVWARVDGLHAMEAGNSPASAV